MILLATLNFCEKKIQIYGFFPGEKIYATVYIEDNDGYERLICPPEGAKGVIAVNDKFVAWL